MSLTTAERVSLRDFLVSRFSLAEIKDLLFELGLSYEDMPHGTRPELARELVECCERNDWLGCLLERVVVKRPDRNMESLISKVPACHPERERVQVILRRGHLKVPPEEFTRIVAGLFDQVSPENVTLIGVAEQGGRALVSIPAAQAVAPAADLTPAAAVTPFGELDPLDQRTWQAGYTAGVWSPRAQLVVPGRPAPGTPALPKRGARSRLPLAGLALVLIVLVFAATLVLAQLNPSAGPGEPGNALLIWLPIIAGLLYVLVTFLGLRVAARRQRPAGLSGPDTLSPGMTWTAAREVVAGKGGSHEK
jgi:hypothetical protein